MPNIAVMEKVTRQSEADTVVIGQYVEADRAFKEGKKIKEDLRSSIVNILSRISTAVHTCADGAIFRLHLSPGGQRSFVDPADAIAKKIITPSKLAIITSISADKLDAAVKAKQITPDQAKQLTESSTAGASVKVMCERVKS